MVFLKEYVQLLSFCYYCWVIVVWNNLRLLGAGYSLNEIADATFEADAIKRSRAETNRLQKWDSIHAMMELTGRNLRKLLMMGAGGGSGGAKPSTSAAKATRRRSFDTIFPLSA